MPSTRDTTVTISVRSILLTGLVLMALVTAYLLGSGSEAGGASPEPEPEAAPAAAEPAGVVRMVGTGEAGAVPDQLTFALSVSSKRADLDDALAASSATMGRVLTRLEAFGVKGEDVQTTGLSMNPEYDYHSYAPPTLTGYRVTQRARVLVEELAQGGRAVAAAIETGGNGVRVAGIQLRVGDPDAVLGEARDAAVEEATEKATQYAEATGQELGEVLSLREVGPRERSRPVEVRGAYRLLAHAAADKAVPIRAGRDDLAVRIEVTWALG